MDELKGREKGRGSNTQRTRSTAREEREERE
jgi:hypothetical protein